MKGLVDISIDMAMFKAFSGCSRYACLLAGSLLVLLAAKEAKSICTEEV